ncbi:MAG: DUF4296 domain-containing protein [Prevotella sp.]|nr:DUF4296 domain-containing protein [Prevotella sp.]
MAACKPGTPKQYIQPDDMEDILVDYHLAKAMALEGGMPQYDRNYSQSLLTAAVLAKHGVTQAEFDSSLVYYYTRSDRFDPIYKRVAERLEEIALSQGASEGDIGKYANFNATGDTANIWPDRTTALMLPAPPYNIWQFNIEADTTFRRGDRLMMQFMSDYMFQAGTKAGVVYLAVTYEDTVVSRNLHFSVSGLSQLRVPELADRMPKSIKGFFYLGQGSEQVAAARLLFLSNVQLIRFHTQHDDEETMPQDSIPSDSVGGRQVPDTVSGGDSLRAGPRLLPADR